MRKQVIVLILLFWTLGASAQCDGNCSPEDSGRIIDTVNLRDFQLQWGDESRSHLGNYGQPFRNLIIDGDAFGSYHQSRIISSFLSKRVNASLDIKKPITSGMGGYSFDEQEFVRLTHFQPIRKNGSFVIGVDKDKSTGIYANQATNNYQFFSLWKYVSNSSKYEIYLNTDYQRLQWQNNGGLTEVEDFLNDSIPGARSGIDVNLDDSQTQVRNFEAELVQKLAFSVSNDSLGNQMFSGLLLELEADLGSSYYSDDNSSDTYYDSVVLLSSEGSDDSIYFGDFDINLGYAFEKSTDSTSFEAKLSGGYRFGEFKWTTTDSINWYNWSHVDLIVKGENSKLQYQLNGDYILSGNRIDRSGTAFSSIRNGNYNVRAYGKYKLGDNVGILVKGRSGLNAPSFDQLYYLGNRRLISNDSLNSVGYNQIGGILDYKDGLISIGALVNNTINPIYFDYFGTQSQFDGTAQVIQMELRSQLALGKFTVRPKAVYQYWGGPNIYQLPEWYADVRLDYEKAAFKNTLNLLFGINLRWYSTTELMAYSPDVSAFTLSNQSSFGNYPFIDFYLNARVQKVRFFLKANHVNSGLMGYKYLAAENYPVRDRQFLVGINWIFVN